MFRLILLRGLPGSGKTTLAKNLRGLIGYDRCEIFAADDYFYDKDGQYNFNPKKLSAAHSTCAHNVMKAMAEGTGTIIVHNTFTTDREMKVYFDLAAASAYNYQVTTLIVENRHGNESVHNVPIETVHKMDQRFSIQLY